MSRCNFTDPSTGMTHQEIIDDLQEEIAAQATQIVELARVRRDLLEAVKMARPVIVRAIQTNIQGIDFDPADHLTVKKIDAVIAKAEGKP